jgi:hypothetical protein
VGTGQQAALVQTLGEIWMEYVPVKGDGSAVFVSERFTQANASKGSCKRIALNLFEVSFFDGWICLQAAYMAAVMSTLRMAEVVLRGGCFPERRRALSSSRWRASQSWSSGVDLYSFSQLALRFLLLIYWL